MDKKTVIQRLRSNQEELEALGVEHLTLFGSVARDEAKPGSDIDLAARFDRVNHHISLVQLGRIQRFLQNMLEAKVGLAIERGLRPHVLVEFERDQIRVF